MATVRQISGANGSTITIAVIPGAAGTLGDAQFVGVTDGTNVQAVTAAGAAKIDGSAVIQPVSGTVALAAGVAAIGSISVSNLPATQPVSAASLPLPTGAAQDTTLTSGSAKTQVTALPALPAGSNAIGTVGVTSLPALPTGGNAIGSVSVSASALPTGAAQDTTLTSGSAKTQGNVASGAADSGNPLKVAGVYNSAAPTLSTGQRGDVQLDSSGNVKVAIAAGGGSGGTASTVGSTYPTIATAIGVKSGATMVALSEGQAAMATSLPVALASDQSAVPVAFAAGPTTAPNAFDSTHTTVALSTGLGGYNAVRADVQGNGYAGNVTSVAEGSTDGTTWYALPATSLSDGSIVTSTGAFLGSGGKASYEITTHGFPQVRMRNIGTGVTSGSALVNLTPLVTQADVPGAATNKVTVRTSDPGSGDNGLVMRPYNATPNNYQAYVDAPVVTYPTGAAQGGSTTTTTSSGANTYTWSPAAPLTKTRTVFLQNNTASNINVAMGTGGSRSATVADLLLVGGQNAILSLDVGITWLSLYTPAALAINNTTAGGIVLWAGV